MGLKPGSIIKVNECLFENDYVQSPNRVFFALMQDDWNFCVYRGTGPQDAHGCLWATNTSDVTHFREPGGQWAIMQDDGNFCVYSGVPGTRGDCRWASSSITPGGQFYAIMQDDGNFCVYKGTGPSDNRGFVWASQAPDSVVDFADISKIDYDVGAAKILGVGSVELYRHTVKNSTPEKQTSTISGSETYTETSGWSDTLGVTVGVKTNFKCGVPVVAEGKVEVSAQVSNTYTWSGSDSRAKTWSFNTPLSVPPHQSMVVLVTAATSRIAVPYTVTGTFVLKSGTRMLGQLNGIYSGENSHDLTVTFLQLDSVTGEMVSSTQKIKATAD